MPFDRRAYMREYVKRYRTIKVNFNEDDDRDGVIYRWLMVQPNKAEYIKTLVETDMKKKGAI